MTTLLELTERVRRRLGTPPGDQLVTPLAIADALNAARERIDAEARWPWNEARRDMTLVAGTNRYALPEDHRASRSVVIAYGAGQPEVLREVSLSEVQLVVSEGTPTGWAIDGTDLVFDRVPNDTYTAVHAYYRTSERLESDSDETTLPSHYADALVWGAVSILATMIDDRRRKEAADIELAAWVARMRKAVRRSTGPVLPRIRPGGWV